MARTLIGMIALGIVWRVARYGACPPMWGDEAFIAVNLLTRDFAGLLKPLEYYQIAPMGFLWAELAVIRVLGASEWAVRLIPFLSGLASLGLFALRASRVLGWWLRGLARPSPFFDARTNAPLSPPRVLTPGGR